MRLTTRKLRPLVLAGFTAAVLTGVGVPAAPATGNGRVDQVEAASLNRASESLPGTDTPIPVAAAGLLVGSAGLAWVVRRSSPSRAL
jgi:hypothetical protein